MLPSSYYYYYAKYKNLDIEVLEEVKITSQPQRSFLIQETIL